MTAVKGTILQNVLKNTGMSGKDSLASNIYMVLRRTLCFSVGVDTIVDRALLLDPRGHGARGYSVGLSDHSPSRQ